MKAVINSKPYFVDYYVSFGELAHETFETMRAMRFFVRQLRPSALIEYGRVEKPKELRRSQWEPAHSFNPIQR
jgi:hypothetical protein